MATRKRKLRNIQREKERVLDMNSRLIKTALDNGCVTRTKISEATGLKITDINNVFRDNLDLKAEYIIYRKTLSDVAADNLAEIVLDKTHPKNYDASKFILTNHKSDLDEILTPKGDDDIIKVEGGGLNTKVNISFGKKEE